MGGGKGTSTERTRRRWPRRLLALVLGALVVEVLLPLFAAHAPLAVRLVLPPPLYVLGESSKSHVRPRDYVLVLGDSYAAGGGDWLMAELAAGRNRPAFQATHVLHEKTGRDVISFGNGGADNVTATAYVASKRFAQLWRTGIGAPEEVVVYFYAGNDLDDDLRCARRHLGLAAREPGSYTDAELDSLVDGRARLGARRGLPGSLYGPYVVQNLIREGLPASVAAAEREELEVVRAEDALPASGSEPTIVLAGGEPYALRVPVQGPGLELTDAETDLALRMLDASLRWVERRFDGARLTLVYLPSPLACYELVSSEVRIQSYQGRVESVSADRVRPRSDALRASVREIARTGGRRFLDATPALRSAGREAPVHGPRDVNHLNRAGYEAVGELLAAELGAPR